VSTFVAAFHGRSERATEGTPNPPVQRASNDKVNHVEWETIVTCRLYQWTWRSLRCRFEFPVKSRNLSANGLGSEVAVTVTFRNRDDTL